MNMRCRKSVSTKRHIATLALSSKGFTEKPFYKNKTDGVRFRSANGDDCEEYLWDVTSYNLAGICRPFRRLPPPPSEYRVCPEDGGSTFLLKVDKFLPAYTVSQSQ
jgi:hypothetical protein